MARRTIRVQLDGALLASLDERAAALGGSRSALIETAVEARLAEDRAAAIDSAIVDGYTRVPQTAEEMRWARVAARRSIADEPW